jgi:hypothetical protein
MGKLRTAMEKASKEYNQERELYAGLEEELDRFETMLSSTVELFTVKDKRKARTLAEWLGVHGQGEANREQGGQHERRSEDGTGTLECNGPP